MKIEILQNILKGFIIHGNMFFTRSTEI